MAQAVPVRVRLSAPTVLKIKYTNTNRKFFLLFYFYLKTFILFFQAMQMNDGMKSAIYVHPIDT